MKPKAYLNFILLGKTRAGKSASGNKILGREAFKSKRSSSSITPNKTVESGTVDGFPVNVYDTPGFCDPELSEEEIQQVVEKVFKKCESGLCVFLLVIKADSFTAEERETVEKIEKLLGEKRIEKTWILFTRGDELEDENTTIQEFLNRNKGLKILVEKYDQRYCVFNNKKKGSSDQARLLLVNILQRSLGLRASDGGRLHRKIHGRPNPHDKQATPAVSLSSRRIVLLGKTGVGKSAAGNTILGKKKFRSEICASSVTSESSVKHATVSGRSVSVVDTPGFFETQMNPAQVMTEIARSICLSSPGPHSFLIVFPVNMRFTEHEQQIPQKTEMMFGQEVLKYSIILFTHGDQLEEETVEELIEKNCALRYLVDQCGGRFHVFNNEDENNREQVNDLLQKIDTMIEQNGGEHYSNQMFEEAQKARKEEKEKKLQEETERLRMEINTIRAEIEAEQKKLQKKKHSLEEIERKLKEKAKWLESCKKSKKKKQGEEGEFTKFFNMYAKNLRVSAFAVGRYILVGEVIAGCVGQALGAAVGVYHGHAGLAAGETAGAALFKACMN